MSKPNFNIREIANSVMKNDEHVAKKAKIEKSNLPPYEQSINGGFHEIIALLKEKFPTKCDNVEIEVPFHLIK